MNLVLLGVLSAYCLNPTLGTIAYGQDAGWLPSDVSGYEVFLAVEDCALVGMEAALHIAGEVYDGIIYDCAGPDAYDESGVTWMESLGVAAEVDWWFWQQNPHLIGVERAEVVIDG